MKDERSASLFDASPRIAPDVQTPAPGARTASPKNGFGAAYGAGFRRSEGG